MIRISVILLPNFDVFMQKGIFEILFRTHLSKLFAWHKHRLY